MRVLGAILSASGAWQLCAKPPDDRSFEDCETLARIARTCPAMAERWSQTQLHALVRCATVTRLAAGESLQVRGSEDQLVVVVHGLLIPALPVADAAGGMKSIGGERDKPEPRFVLHRPSTCAAPSNPCSSSTCSSLVSLKLKFPSVTLSILPIQGCAGWQSPRPHGAARVGIAAPSHCHTECPENHWHRT